MENKKNQQKPLNNKPSKPFHGNKPFDKEKEAKEKLEKKRLEFITIIRRKCTFSVDLENMKLDEGSGYASKKFKIFRQGDKAWVVTKGDLITWSNEKFLMIQQIEHEDSKVIEVVQKQESFWGKVISAVGQGMIEQGKKHIQKTFTRRFDIQWKNITGIGD